MASKVYKTHNQLLKILRDRGLVIEKGSVGSRVKRTLEKENYYNVVNGYKELFIDTPATATSQEKYKTGATFDEIYALYEFDRELRSIHLKYLLKIENHFKTAIAHWFSKNYGYDNYLKLENFYCSSSTRRDVLNRIAKKHRLDIKRDIDKIKQLSAAENVENVTRLIGGIQQDLARQLNKNHEMITHYMTVHGYIPLWVLVNVLTFGKVTKFYLYMKEHNKIEVAREYGVHFIELHKYMDMLGIARNKCAHDERFFDIRFRKEISSKNIPNFSILSLPMSAAGSYSKGTKDAYAIAIMFKQLLSKNDFNQFYRSVDSAIGRLSKKLKTISDNDVLEVMGYTSTWRNINKL